MGTYTAHTEHRHNLDILRALAVSFVLIDHLALSLHTHLGLGQESHRRYVVALGHAGVLLFFVHTSLVLMYSIERMHLSGEKVIIPFYVRRFFRIYPLAIATILLALIFHVPYKVWDTPAPVSMSVVIANLLLVQNLWTRQQVLAPLWSLPYEVEMYLVLPALFVVTRSKRALTSLTALIAFFCLVGIVIAVKTSHLNMAAYVPCFLAGVLSYALRRRIRPSLPSFLWPIFLTVLVLILLVAYRGEEDPPFWCGWIFCIILAFAINMFRDSQNRLVSFTAEKIALYSYGMYLLHVPVQYLVFVYWGATRIYSAVGLTLLLTGIAAVAAFHFIEAPFIGMGRLLSSTSGVGSRLDGNAEAPPP